MYGRRVPLVKQFQRSIIDKASSRPGASGSIEGRLHSISLTYKPSISLSGSLALGRLVCSGGPIVVSTAGASLIARLALGSPPAGAPSSSYAQASLVASWAAPSKSGRASEACSGKSIVIITVRLFQASSSRPDRLEHFPPDTSESR